MSIRIQDTIGEALKCLPFYYGIPLLHFHRCRLPHLRMADASPAHHRGSHGHRCMDQNTSDSHTRSGHRCSHHCRLKWFCCCRYGCSTVEGLVRECLEVKPTLVPMPRQNRFPPLLRFRTAMQRLGERGIRAARRASAERRVSAERRRSAERRVLVARVLRASLPDVQVLFSPHA